MQVLHSYHVMHTFANDPFYQQPAYQVIHMVTISANRPIETSHPKDFSRLGNLLAEARRVDPIISPLPHNITTRPQLFKDTPCGNHQQWRPQILIPLHPPALPKSKRTLFSATRSATPSVQKSTRLSTSISSLVHHQP